MQGDRAADLSFGAIQVPENHLDFERIGARARGLRQLVDRLIDVIVDEEVEAEHVVRRLAQAAAVDPPAVAQLVALPRLADDEAEQQREQRGEKRQRLAHPRYLKELRPPEIVQMDDALNLLADADDDD